MNKYRTPPPKKPLYKFGYRHYCFIYCFPNAAEMKFQKCLVDKLYRITKKLQKDINNRILQDEFISLKHEIEEREKSLNIDNYEQLRVYFI